MEVKRQLLIDPIAEYCKSLEKEFDQIEPARQERLRSLGDYLLKKYLEGETPKVIIICTHNSRRSHLGQIWLAAGADYYQLPEMDSFSGGTLATAFNPRAVYALRRAGFQIDNSTPEDSNPRYDVRWKENMEPYVAFSKAYGDDPNPKSQFGAVMVCSEADGECPLVSGSDFRLALPYDDPKDFDGTTMEMEKYDERCRQIGREMLFSLSHVRKEL